MHDGLQDGLPDGAPRLACRNVVPRRSQPCGESGSRARGCTPRPRRRRLCHILQGSRGRSLTGSLTPSFACFRFKDGRPYPWPGDISNFILYPESANQTVYSKMTGPKDGGNYSCLVRNDSHAYMHNVALSVIGNFIHLFRSFPSRVSPRGCTSTG